MEEVFHKWLVYIQVMIGVLYWLENKVIDLGSDTFGNPIFQNGLTKVNILPDYNLSITALVALSNFAALSKIGPILVKKCF
jgi:hypothetical protein